MQVKRRYCAVCSCEIAAERLKLAPNTRLCVIHAEEIKKYGGEFIGSGSYGSLGKKDSLKKNYGDVSVTWKRNEEAQDKVSKLESSTDAELHLVDILDYITALAS